MLTNISSRSFAICKLKKSKKNKLIKFKEQKKLKIFRTYYDLNLIYQKFVKFGTLDQKSHKIVYKLYKKFETHLFLRENYLKNLLGVMPGSVTPFALLNNTKNNVNFYLEDKLYNAEFINFHPLVNTATVTIKSKDFVEFMIENNKKIHIFSSSNETIVKTYG